MIPVQADKERAHEGNDEDASRFDDLWAISDAQIEAGMETLNLDQINKAARGRRGR